MVKIAPEIKLLFLKTQPEIGHYRLFSTAFTLTLFDGEQEEEEEERKGRRRETEKRRERAGVGAKED